MIGEYEKRLVVRSDEDKSEDRVVRTSNQILKSKQQQKRRTSSYNHLAMSRKEVKSARCHVHALSKIDQISEDFCSKLAG